MLQVPFGCPSVSHVGSPSVQVSVAPFEFGVAFAVDVSQIAAQLPALPATIVACACGNTEREKASASAVLGRLILIRGLLRRRAPRAPDCWDRLGTISSSLRCKPLMNLALPASFAAVNIDVRHVARAQRVRNRTLYRKRPARCRTSRRVVRGALSNDTFLTRPRAAR